MEIAPGIRRIGPGVANSYLLEESGEITIVDTGMPGYWKILPAELAAMGRSLDDVRAVLLTHAHSDHMGFAERIRRTHGTAILIHEADALLAQGKATTPRSIGTIRIGALVRFFAFAARNGALSRIPPVAEVATFGDGATLDVPGSPRVIHLPGHTAGSAALHATSRDALFVGDAFVTLNVLSGETGPLVGPFNADTKQTYASLARLERVQAGLALPGHGQPWTEGIGAALERIRARSGA